jgi:hypothetical protein
MGGVAMRKVVCLIMLCLLILSNTVLASNWVYVGRSYEYHSNFYIDTETIVKKGDYITFWDIEILDVPDADVKKIMTHFEAKWTTPRRYREIEYYYYDTQNNELWYDNNEWYDDYTFYSIQSGSIMDLEIDAALRYAR